MMNSLNERLLVVSGGIGFIGSSFCDVILERDANTKVICVDKLTSCTSPRTIEYLTSKYDASRFELIVADICDDSLIEKLEAKLKGRNYEIVNFAAESLVDTSFQNPRLAIHTNIYGTMNLLEFARKSLPKCTRFVQMSTDEVYGEQIDADEESSALVPTTPYAASKASAELLVSSYHTTWKIPALIIRCCNVYGPRQHPEKLVSKICRNLTQNPNVPLILHGNGSNKRRYLYIVDAIEAIETLREKGQSHLVYNVGAGAESEISNLALAQKLIAMDGQDPSSLIEFGPDRLYNDSQYSMRCERISSLGWQPKIDLDQGIRQTLEWVKLNAEWFAGSS